MENSVKTQDIPTMSLPYELLRDIFRQATFIPHEWDVNYTSIVPGLFCMWDQFQVPAWKEVLPLRRAIAHVSRTWRALSLEFLYGTFHDDDKGRSIESFASILLDCPYYGTLVKRLTIRVTGEPEHDARVAGIMLKCSNLLIIDIHDTPINGGSGLFTVADLTLFSTTIRQLGVANVPMSTVFAIIIYLQNLEILSIKLMLDSDWTPTPLIVLPNLRILQFISPYSAPVDMYMRSLKVPRLSALSINICAIPQWVPRLPNDMAKRLLCLEFIYPFENIRGWDAGDLPNLRCLRLRWRHLKSDLFRSQLPMKQIVELTCDLAPFEDNNLSTYQSHFERIMSFTLDPNSMPNLKFFILNLYYATRDLLRRKDQRGRGVREYFMGLIAAFDRRGVDLYCYPGNQLHGKILIRDILEA